MAVPGSLFPVVSPQPIVFPYKKNPTELKNPLFFFYRAVFDLEKSNVARQNLLQEHLNRTQLFANFKQEEINQQEAASISERVVPSATTAFYLLHFWGSILCASFSGLR